MVKNKPEFLPIKNPFYITSCFTVLKSRLTCPPCCLISTRPRRRLSSVTHLPSLSVHACLNFMTMASVPPHSHHVRCQAEWKYSTSERETLASLWACEHWNFNLYGRQFTDHQALKTLLTTGHQRLCLHRWSDRLFQSHVHLVNSTSLPTVCLVRLSFPTYRK